jgi:DNA-binding MarR family transcriptional regulator
MEIQIEIEKITAVLLRIIKLAETIENSPIDIGHGTILTASEFHFIDITNLSPDENLSSIASILGVTKGAVSQMVQKLETKGYITKNQLTDNRKNRTLTLTKKGEEAFLWHKTLHDRMNKKFMDNISNFAPEQINITCNILMKYETMLATSLDIRKDHLMWFKNNILQNNNYNGNLDQIK